LEPELTKVAKDINSTLDQADKAETRADDLRITAALMLAEAEKICITAGRPFKSWVKENIKDRAYTTVMALTAVGRSEDPRQALDDWRAERAMQKRESRARRADLRRLRLPDGTLDEEAEAETADARHSKAHHTGSKSNDNKSRTLQGVIAGPKETSVERAMAAIEALPEMMRTKVAEFTAEQAGLAVVSIDVARKIRKAEALAPYDAAKQAFKRLSAADKIRLAEFAAEQVGGTFEAPEDEAPADDDLMAIPPLLRRQPQDQTMPQIEE